MIPVLFLFLLAGCNKSPDYVSELEGFQTKEKALEHYISEETIYGSIELVKTTLDEQILVVEPMKNVFTIGEFITHNGEYKMFSITGRLSLRGTVGGSKEFTTSKGNTYTIKFLNEIHSNSLPFPKRKYHYSISEGAVNSDKTATFSNAIVSTESIKK